LTDFDAKKLSGQVKITNDAPTVIGVFGCTNHPANNLIEAFDGICLGVNFAFVPTKLDPPGI
jgi:hypothetical protein